MAQGSIVNDISKSLNIAGGLGGVIGSLISIFSRIGGGCGNACIEASKAVQVFIAAAIDIEMVVGARMISGSDAAILEQEIFNHGITFLSQLAQQGDPRAEPGIRILSGQAQSYITSAAGHGDATQPLDLLSAQRLFLSPSTPNWYPDAIVSGNNLATQILQTLLSQGIQAASQADVSSVLGGLLSNLDSALAAQASAHSSVLSSVLTGIAALSGAGSKAGVSTTDKILSGILGTFGVSAGTINSIERGVTTALSDVNKAVNYINTNVIQGVIDPILESMQKASALQTAIEGDLKNGIAGILQIPAQLAEAYNSTATSYKAAAILRNDNATSVSSNILVPGIGGAVGEKLQQLHEGFQDLLAGGPVDINELGVTQLSEPNGETVASQLIDKFNAELHRIPKLFSNFLQPLWDLLLAVEAYGASIGPAITEAEQLAAAKNPVKTLGLSDVVQGLVRGELSQEQANLEANRQGLSSDRLSLLRNLTYKLLETRDAINAMRRGIISDEDMRAELRKNNWAEDRIDALLELTEFLPNPETAADWYARGIITLDAFRAVLKAASWTEGDIDAYIVGLFRPEDLSDYVRYSGRMAAAAKGFLSDTYQQAAPDDVASVGKQNRMSPALTNLAWLAHWKDIDARNWVQMAFRGIIDNEQLHQALTSLNYPSEVQDAYIASQRPLIEFYYLPQFFSSGILQGEELDKYLTLSGYDDYTKSLLIRYVEFSQLGAVTAQNTAYAELSVTILKQMWDARIIDVTQFEQGLRDHGYTSEDAALLTNLYQTQKSIGEHKTYAASLVKRVQSGDLTKLQALDMLGGQGFTQGEIQQYDTEIEAAKINAAKLPSESQLNKMLTSGIIDEGTWVQTMSKLGYSAEWIPRMLSLIQS